MAEEKTSGRCAKAGRKRARTATRADNRKQQKRLKRQLYCEHPGLEIVHPDAAGIDVGKETHFVAVPPGRDTRPVQEFGCFTADLKRLAEWLIACGIKTVAMQSTGVYWIALHDILQQHGLEVFLVNARDTRNLPGRKTDVQESQWLMKLHTYGLLRNSFRPPEQIQKIRTVWRMRDRLVKDAARSIQHMQKALTQMNLQLANVISDVSGATGMQIIRAMLQGERDGRVLAKFRDWRVKASEEEIARSLEGHWREDLLFELQQAVETYDFIQQQLGRCDKRLQRYLNEMPARDIQSADMEAKADGTPKQGEASKSKTKKKSVSKRAQGNAPQSFDLRAELKRVAGVDLTTINGIDVMVAQTIIAEVGVDPSRWPSEQQFAAQLGLAPSRDVSGGKVIKKNVRKVKNRAGAALRMGAQTLLRSDCYLGAKYRALRARLGAPRAIKAMARMLACLIYRLLRHGQAWVDNGAAEFERRRSEREQVALQRRAAAIGMRLVHA